jgi:hypothetical protein
VKNILRTFLEEMGWPFEVSRDETEASEIVRTMWTIDDGLYEISLIADERRQAVAVMACSPIEIPKHRLEVAAVVVNYLNGHMRCGNFQITSKGSVYYRNSLLVEGGSVTNAQIELLIKNAAGHFDKIREEAFNALARSNRPANAIVARYQETIEAHRGSGKGPCGTIAVRFAGICKAGERGSDTRDELRLDAPSAR